MYQRPSDSISGGATMIPADINNAAASNAKNPLLTIGAALAAFRLLTNVAVHQIVKANNIEITAKAITRSSISSPFVISEKHEAAVSGIIERPVIRILSYSFLSGSNRYLVSDVFPNLFELNQAVFIDVAGA